MLDGGCHSEHRTIPCLALLFPPFKFPTLHPPSPSLARGLVLRVFVSVCVPLGKNRRDGIDRGGAVQAWIVAPRSCGATKPRRRAR